MKDLNTRSIIGLAFNSKGEELTEVPVELAFDKDGNKDKTLADAVGDQNFNPNKVVRSRLGCFSCHPAVSKKYTVAGEDRFWKNAKLVEFLPKETPTVGEDTTVAAIPKRPSAVNANSLQCQFFRRTNTTGSYPYQIVNETGAPLGRRAGREGMSEKDCQRAIAESKNGVICVGESGLNTIIRIADNRPLDGDASGTGYTGPNFYDCYFAVANSTRSTVCGGFGDKVHLVAIKTGTRLTDSPAFSHVGECNDWLKRITVP